MKLIAIAAVVVCLYMMFTVKKEYKIDLLVLGSMILYFIKFIISMFNKVLASFSYKTIKLAHVCC